MSKQSSTYAISSVWFFQWIKFTQFLEPPPGSIDNLSLYKKLVKDKEKDVKEGVDYILIQKEQWYFLFNIYGGGPTIFQ